MSIYVYDDTTGYLAMVYTTSTDIDVTSSVVFCEVGFSHGIGVLVAGAATEQTFKND